MKKKPSKMRKKMNTKDRVLSKFTTGRTKALKKRKKTLLVEYKLMNKSNKFVDRRLGERNRNMTADDRVMARFVAQRMKAHNKKQMFNLETNDEEILTHRGRTIAEVEKYDTVRSDSEEDDDGNLDAKFVERAHFGGGLFTKVPASHENNHQRSTIDELIAESKRRKAERQLVKEETEILTEKLDKDLKELFPAITKRNADVSQNATETKSTSESYDVLVRELKFERVGKGTSLPKVNADDAKLLLAKERERDERMKSREEFDEDEIVPSTKHVSADDLDDGLDLDNFNVFRDEEDDSMEEDEEEEGGGGEEEEGEGEKGDIETASASKDGMTIEKKVVKTQKPPLVPQKIEILLETLDGKSAAERIEIIRNLINSQKVHAGVSIKEYVANFFKVLIQYIDITVEEERDSWNFVNHLSPILFELTEMVGDDAAYVVRTSLKEKYEHFLRNKSNVQEKTLIFLKLIPILFPTSDYYHPVTTPAATFISHLLSENSCKTLKCIAEGLFLSTTMLEFVHVSSRYCPESINFLRNVLYTAIPNFEDVCPPVRTQNKILVLNTNHKTDDISADKLKLSFSIFKEDIREDDGTRMAILSTVLRISNAYCQLYEAFSAAEALWLPMRNLLNLLPIETFPAYICSQIKDLRRKIRTVSERQLKYLQTQKKRPKALRLYEPNIRPVIDGKSFRTVSRANLEKEKLMRQYKKEKKGAYREIRKDQKLLSRVMISEQIQRDVERKEKVKQIFSWGQNQQSELKRMERKNRFKR